MLQSFAVGQTLSKVLSFFRPPFSALFAASCRNSRRNVAIDLWAVAALRDRLFHDFGPTHVAEVAREAKKLNPLMRNFLSCRELVVDRLEKQAREQTA